MSLQRRLLVYLLIAAPLVWVLTLGVSVHRARHEVNELFDTQLIRLARQVQATLRPGLWADDAPLSVAPAASEGEADVEDLSVAVWDRQGRMLLADREGVALPHRRDASGFVDVVLGGDEWRVYYLQSFEGEWLVAAGQKAYERDELIFDLSSSQLLPWVVLLPLLLGAMAWAVRQALRPVSALADELSERSAGDLHALPLDRTPEELLPMVSAMNGLFARIETTMARERQFTADAAHELRTPLAALHAQWDVLCNSRNDDERRTAQTRVGRGIERLDRLVTQMLALSRIEVQGASLQQDDVRWPAVVEQAFSDCLPLAERRHIELACEWPTQVEGAHAFPVLGDEHLMTVMLRNLLDNAIRYAPEGTAVTLRLASDHLTVENDGEPLSDAVRARLGERFFRPDGQDERGSGLGLSIVQRIAALHGLTVVFGARADGRGTQVRVAFATPAERSTL